MISGNGSNLQAIIDSGLVENISIVISNEPDVYGLIRAQNSGIATKVINHRDFQTRELFDEALIDAIDSTHSDFIILAGFMRILTDAFIQHYISKIINIHPSLLPKYKGLNTHRRVLEAGDSCHGPTVHYVVPELDSGTIIEQSPFEIPANCDEQTLVKMVQQHEHELYPRVIKSLMT